MPRSELPKLLFARFLLVFLIPSIASVAFGQSVDISSPSPVRTNEIVGRITARDLGDSRLTDHFYTFIGTPGDVLITVKSNNLNGDVDVFTVAGLRPLLKFTLYAESSTPVTKSIFLRKREDLILRVEARTPNDDEGIYQIRLGGAFEPAAGEDLLAAAETPTTEPSVAVPAPGRGTTRVSSVGARIAEPQPPPVEEVATATPTPEPTPAPVETPTTAATPEPAAEPEAPRPEPPRTVRRAGRRRPVPARRVDPPPEPETQTGPRLIIEMLNGTRVELFMSTLKRVTVENNQIVILNKLGRIQRHFMLEVKRMSIEP